MRFFNKYKGYQKVSLIFEKFPLRVARFKSTKWKRVQRLLSFKMKRRGLKKRKTKRRLFFNNFLTKVSTRGWYRVENYYENGRRIQSTVSNMFDKVLSKQFFKKALNLSYKSHLIDKVYVSTLLKPEFRIDILLWKLSFFRSCYQASQAICERKIKVNFKYVKGNYYLRKGDIITFDSFRQSKCLVMTKIRLDFLFSKRFLTFVEVDYYSNSIVVLKDFDELGLEDFFILVKEYHSLKKVKDYI